MLYGNKYGTVWYSFVFVDTEQYGTLELSQTKQKIYEGRMNDDAFCFLLAVVTYKASWKQSL